MKRYILLFAVAALTLNASADEIKSDSVGVQGHSIAAIEKLKSPIVVDTIATDNKALSVILFNDNTWRYVQTDTIEQDSTVFSA